MVRGPLSCKAKGELGELAFAHKAAALGFGVAKPHGDNEPYDFIVDSGERLWRVQVKSIYSLSRGGYRAAGERCNHIPYKQEEIDFLVAYIVPLRIWYVIPANRVAVSTALAFYPSGCRQDGGRFEPFAKPGISWRPAATQHHNRGYCAACMPWLARKNIQQSQGTNFSWSIGTTSLESTPPMG